MAKAKISAEINMFKDLSNILTVKRSIIKPIGKRPQAQSHILYFNKSNSFCRSFKSAIASFAIKTVRIKVIRTLLQNIQRNKGIVFVSIKLLIIFSISFSVYAKDFGTQGHSYQITEQEFLQMIAERLKKIDMKKEQEKMQGVVRDRVENPRAVEAVKPAVAGRSFYFDPTYTLDRDVVLPCGKVLHKAGMQVNPLEHMDLNRRMLFIDGREEGQVKWLKEQLDNPLPKQKESVEDRVILVGGSVFKLKELIKDKHKNKVYFDQNGELTTRFGITGSPAVVVQDGLQLKIEEIKLIKDKGKR